MTDLIENNTFKTALYHHVNSLINTTVSNKTILPHRMRRVCQIIYKLLRFISTLFQLQHLHGQMGENPSTEGKDN